MKLKNLPDALSTAARKQRLKLSDTLDLVGSRSLDVSNCKSVCLALGPYRNLTTLTAATLFLHPNCQVLNHAGSRIYTRPELNFLSEYSAEKMDRFIQFAVKISTKGERGDVGGSIVHSHAFDPEHDMRELSEKAGSELLKENIRCLFWKESLITANYLRDNSVDLAPILNQEPRLRFLMPIRNPMDCAVSNLKTGHVKLFSGLDQQSPVADVVAAILKEIQWFAGLEQQYPGRFFRYFEHEISREMLTRLAQFLELEPTEEWLALATQAMKTKPSYPHPEDLRSFYAAQVREKFGSYPEITAGLMKFLER